MRNKSLRKFWVKEQKFSYKILQGESSKIIQIVSKTSKTPLFSVFFTVFVPRETDDENRIVPRETYMFFTVFNTVAVVVFL